MLALMGAAPAAAVANSLLPSIGRADSHLPPDWSKVPTRTVSRYDILYKTAHAKPNDLSPGPNPGEMWVLDQGLDRWITLSRISDGSTIREFQGDAVGPSGLVVDEENIMWVTGTHASMIHAIDATTGKTIAKYYTPGAGRIFNKKGDPPGRQSKLQPAYPTANRAVGGATNNVRNRRDMPPGQLPMDTVEGAGGTGAHGILAKGSNLIYANPPSRMVYVIDKKTWVVQDMYPTPGNRPHGMTWADSGKTSFWLADSNLNAFFRYDANGYIVEKVQLGDDSPVIHGIHLAGNQMYCCDDLGWMWRFQI
jgi:hypothetical protein